jgi:lipopolysaccharide/colanic/teichoic acid biosynthesis glycosyltransferase
MGTDRDANHPRFSAAIFSEGCGVTEPVPAERRLNEGARGTHRAPTLVSRTHIAKPLSVDSPPPLRVVDGETTQADAKPAVVRLVQSDRANRVLNIVLAATALFILSPILILVAIAVKLTSRGPILYTQIRVGVDARYGDDRRLRHERRMGRDRRLGMDRRARYERRAMRNRRMQPAYAVYGRRHENIGGHPFRIYKFRSMCVGAECGVGAVWATRGDCRVTPVGRVLRTLRLDELPQLINVLKGDMNLVGPRPERPSIFCRLRTEIPEYPLRQRARPGITGWAQIRHTYDSCIEDVRKKVTFDLEYLDRRSLWRDISIMVKTIPVMIFRRGGW